MLNKPRVYKVGSTITVELMQAIIILQEKAERWDEYQRSLCPAGSGGTINKAIDVLEGGEKMTPGDTPR